MNHQVVSQGCGVEKGLISIDQALALILTHSHCLDTEVLPLSQTLNRYLADDIFSKIDLPLFSQSAVDGYALSSQEPVEAGTQFDVVGEVRAGQTVDVKLLQGQALRIFTGSQIPIGTTTVARQEIVEVLSTQVIRIDEKLKQYADIREKGEELTQGQRLAPAGQKLNTGVIAALSMAGIKQLKVFRYPKIAVVITGDEVAETVECLNSGKIFDANGPLIQAWFQTHNQSIDVIHVDDQQQQVLNLFDELKNQYDLIISTGGVSVGDYDFVRPVALKLGFEQIFWKVKQKPGKPMLFAKYQRKDQRHCYLLALPGNPAAVYIGMQVYVSTLLDALQGHQSPPQWQNGIISHTLKSDARERFLRMSAVFEQGHLSLKSLAKQQSHMLSNLIHANCIVRVPAEQDIQKGQILPVLFIQN